MAWSQELWVCVHKGVKVRMVNGNAKSFLWWERGTVLKQPNETNSSLKTLYKKCNKN